MSKHSEPRFGRQDALTPFRAMADAPTRSYRVRAGHRVELKFGGKPKQLAAYSVTPLSTDFGGCAFRLTALDGSGKTYEILVGGVWESCSCAGWCYRERCRHLDAIKMLLSLGVLQAAPGSNAGDEEAA